MSAALGAGGRETARIRPSGADSTASPASSGICTAKVRRYAKEEIVTHYEIDDVKWRVAEMLGESFGLYSEDEIAELEAALRTDDPEERQRIHDKWAQRPPIERGDPPLPNCLDCRRAMRFGYPPQCEKHPYVPTGQPATKS